MLPGFVCQQDDREIFLRTFDSVKQPSFLFVGPFNNVIRSDLQETPAKHREIHVEMNDNSGATCSLLIGAMCTIDLLCRVMHSHMKDTEREQQSVINEAQKKVF